MSLLHVFPLSAKGDICRRTLCYLCAIGNICRHSYISLNFAGLLSTVARISSQFSMTSHSEKVALNAITFNMMTGHFVRFVGSFAKKTNHFTAKLGTNKTKHTCI